MKIKRIVLLGIILIIVLTLTQPVNRLAAVDYKTNEMLTSWRVNDNDSFTIRFTHSVMLTPVYEVYTINDDFEIILTETLFYSYGAGLPENTIYDFEITENGFRIYNINKKLDKLVYRTGATVANHTFIMNKIEIPFLEFSDPQAAVEFKIVSRPLIAFLYEEVLTWISKIMKF